MPGLEIARKTAVTDNVKPIEKMVGPLAPRRYVNSRRYGLQHLVMVALLTALATAFLASPVLRSYLEPISAYAKEQRR